MTKRLTAVPVERIEHSIWMLRGERVILDAEIAALYGVQTRVLIQAIKRNLDRFPSDFMFQLSWEEAQDLRSRIVTSSSLQRSRSQTVILKEGEKPAKRRLRSQPVILKQGSNVKYRPYAFTEQGVAMLSSVLRSRQAVQVNIEIMRAFVRLRQMLASHKSLARKIDALEKKYDSQFKIIFDALRALMAGDEDEPKRKPIGYHTEREAAGA